MTAPNAFSVREHLPGRLELHEGELSTGIIARLVGHEGDAQDEGKRLLMTRIADALNREGRENWRDVASAPRDGTTIIGLYEGGESQICWSERPVCILGSRNGGYPPGWATAGNDTDRNLPMDPPLAWRAALSRKEAAP